MTKHTHTDKEAKQKTMKEMNEEICLLKKQLRELGAKSYEGAYIDGDKVKSFIKE